ncbi:MAG: hypothetical protein D6696_04005 [Acidobacteria bacterium]|nr:MAG: hypothetical protein D6696_04005 [Acidobacteriota bacterium]
MGGEHRLSEEELAQLVERVFAPSPQERKLAILADLPDAALPDRPAWRDRRHLAAGWARRLERAGYDVALVLYRNARSPNAELPETAWRHEAHLPLPDGADRLDPADAVPLAEVFARHPLILAPTELSATAPLKLLAPRYGFRAATMPGFSRRMIPALRLDYGEIDRRVRALAALLDAAAGAELIFRTGGDELRLDLDLRHRRGHASGGRMTRPGEVGNLPSGESYVVPYEGERDGDPSRTQGILPVQLAGGVVRFRIAANRAVEVSGDEPAASEQAALLAAEPARGNLAELGLGVLADLGLEPIGEILLDEKLGLHLAFGRSDHFGGRVGPSSFSRPEAVVHLDHVYLPQLQPAIEVQRLDLVGPGGGRTPLMRRGRYVIEL